MVSKVSFPSDVTVDPLGSGSLCGAEPPSLRSLGCGGHAGPGGGHAGVGWVLWDVTSSSKRFGVLWAGLDPILVIPLPFLFFLY
jgi:hypothetical protein